MCEREKERKRESIAMWLAVWLLTPLAFPYLYLYSILNPILVQLRWSPSLSLGRRVRILYCLAHLPSISMENPSPTAMTGKRGDRRREDEPNGKQTLMVTHFVLAVVVVRWWTI